MWNPLRKGKPWPIGLDISPDGIRMLQLCSLDAQLAVHEGAFWRPVHEGITGASLNPALAVRAVQEILCEGDFLGRRAVTAVGWEDLRVQVLRVPARSDEELTGMVQAKSEECFQDTPLDGLYVLRGGPVIGMAEPTQELLLVGILSQAVANRRNWLEAMGLRLAGVDAEPLALFRSFRRLQRRGGDSQVLRVILRVSHTDTLVLVAQGSHPLLIRNLPRGGNHLTAAAAEKLGLRTEEAAQLREQIMHEYALHAHRARTLTPALQDLQQPESVLWTVHDAVREEAEALISEIGLCLRYCMNTFGCPKIERALLAGEGAWDPSLIYLLHERLGLTCEGAEPLRGIDVSQCSLFADRRTSLADWATCMGLACRASERHESQLAGSMSIPTVEYGSEGEAE